METARGTARRERCRLFLARADVVFPAIHGPLGEDGTLAALCALTHKPVVGSGMRAGTIGMDKWAKKLVAEAIGLRTALGRLVHAADVGDIELETEVVVKTGVCRVRLRHPGGLRKVWASRRFRRTTSQPPRRPHRAGRRGCAD
jgi:D-ala D-ala ligase N-terminus